MYQEKSLAALTVELREAQIQNDTILKTHVDELRDEKAKQQWYTITVISRKCSTHPHDSATYEWSHSDISSNRPRYYLTREIETKQ